MRCLSVFNSYAGKKLPSAGNNNNPSRDLPDVPTGVTLLPRSPCGIHVLWNPVRYVAGVCTGTL